MSKLQLFLLTVAIFAVVIFSNLGVDFYKILSGGLLVDLFVLNHSWHFYKDVVDAWKVYTETGKMPK